MSETTGRFSFNSADVAQTISVTSRYLCKHDLVVPNRTNFGARFSRSQLGRTSFIRLAYGSELEVRSAPLGTGVFLLEIPLSGFSLTRFGGCEVRGDLNVGCIIGPNAPFSTTWSADCSKLLVTIDRASAEAQLCLLTGRSLQKPLAFEAEVALSVDGGRALRTLADAVAAEAESNLAAPERSSLHASLETAFLTALLVTQPHNHSDLIRSRSGSAAAPWYVRRAEDFIQKNFAGPITLSDLADTVGVSERTLQTGFMRFRGGSPMTCLRNHRLDEAKRRFETARGGEGVGAVARAVGFSDMSKFARAYRERFGCNPRDALRRVH